MKIDGIGKPAPVPSNPIRNVDRAGGFGQILERQMGAVSGTAGAAVDTGRQQVMDRSDTILNLLDDYARQLADPSRPLKQISPLVDSIANEVKALEDNVAAAAPEDKALVGLVRRVAVTANVAMIKFHRGDFV